MDTAKAFAAYEAVRHRLPAAVPSRQPAQRVATLEDIAEDYDAFLLDAFGVLNIGETAIPGVVERVRSLKARGKRVIVVSNAAGFPHATLMQKYHRLGYDFTAEDVITSRATLLAAIGSCEGLHLGLMATPSAGLRDLEALNVTYLEEDPAPYAEVDGFLMIGSAAWTEQRYSLLVQALTQRTRPVWVGNPDIVAPRETGFSVEPGYFAHRLADQTGVAPQFFGKPFGNIFELAFQRLGSGIPRNRIVMVGDSLHTDILGAQAAGIGSALISDYGFFAGYDVDSAIRDSGIVPTYVASRP
ncbi:TIGR01459 family HAD-type hydrolase [Litoreibacter arenae]|uniref:HAD superfamily protein involved in N-acetyl-glucosamine catabolism n=1 Tax=Litoreibacter arenae DSM 19593 TaxID=1123360 RepID=S9QDU3_9RHOB|nr:TIGR01459 family HAD-type hydrolase [Litoreibacter arenae]EPX77768.1 HAD superfamily protein involved in N-acetyl-glucosamine catabolism [Litoreibacter arenae DSM 19593]